MATDPRVTEGNQAWKETYPFKRYITVRTQFRGFHAYKDAPEQVAFLKHSHRHLFKVTVQISVHHNDRDLEFFMVQDVLDKQILAFTNLMENLGSCEMIAERIAQGLINTYGTTRDYKVTVSEDGESDGTVVFDRHAYLRQQLHTTEDVDFYRFETVYGKNA